MNTYTNIQLLIVLTCLPILIHVQGNVVLNNSDKKLIIVNPVVGYNIDVNITIADQENGIPLGDCDIDDECFIDSCICSNGTKCVCSIFEDAFNHVENNTVVAINGTIEEFTANITLSNIANISIIGYHKTAVVNCSVRGLLEFKNCNNIIIENITWISCGHNEDYRLNSAFKGRGASYDINFHDHFLRYYFYGLKVTFCTSITLKSCTFEASMISIYEASGVICIDQVHFLSTSAYDVPGPVSPIHQATGLIINQTGMLAEKSVVVKINNSLFSQAGCSNPCRNLLLLYVFVSDPLTAIQVLISQTNFSSISYDPGWAAENGMVWIRILSSRDAYIVFNEVKFLSNNFQPEIRVIPSDFTAMLHVTSESYKMSRKSTSIKMESCTFLNNYGNSMAVFYGDVYLEIRNTNFHNNMADSILNVTYSFFNNFITTTLKIVHSAFSSNTGGQLMFLAGKSILVNISGLQITRNVLSSSNGGLVVFKDYDNIIADISNVRYEFNYIRSRQSGFRFTSANINNANLVRPRAVTKFTICIPRYFHLVLPQAPFGLPNCISDMYFQWYSIMNSSFNNNIGGEHGAVILFSFGAVELSNNTISTSTFNNNSRYRSLIYTSSNSSDISLVVKDSTFTRNEESVFYIVNQTLQFSNDMKMTLFDGNRAQNGAALSLDLNSKVIFTNTSAVTFTNNIARRYGGAIYYEILQSTEACYRNLSTFIVYYNALVVFNNNQARNGGNSVFFSISQACNGTLQYDANFERTVGEIVMSPYKLRLYYPAQLVSNINANIDTYYISDITLGQNIVIPACTLNLNGMPLWSTQFTIELVENNHQNYSIQGNDVISVDCRTLQGINNLVITGMPPLINSTLTIRLHSFYDTVFHWRPIRVRLKVQLSSCHSGFYYSSDLEHCVCYTTDDIVTCSGSNSTIRNGYWFGTINDQPTVTLCPLNYCNFDSCESATGTCDLYPLRDNQCQAHRSGAACGSCEEGYTLSFDSIHCISKERCNIGQTVLVITISFLYWIAVIVLVFGIMYFNIDIGYLYGITFYYSIIDILLEKTLQINEGVNQLVTILSSIAKLRPQFLGRLCFVEGMSGIDQHFIHYLHPLAVLLIVLLISIIARFSRRFSLFLSRVVIHGICLLLLLSYTSIASTSLLLIRSIRYTNIDMVYSYLSPDIEYFHGRHLMYVLIASLTGLVIMIGLPLLLSLEPFINSKINFIKIKPLLDQFQGCYKDKFRYFASYYMIFRLIILTIIVINATNNFVTLYLMLASCSLMMFIHIAVRPYTNNALNLFDSFMLLTMSLIISLLIIETNRGFESSTTTAITIILVIMPLLAFLVMIVYLHLQKLKKFTVYCINTIKKQPKPADHPTVSTENIELHDLDTVVDQQVRDRSTTTTIMIAKGTDKTDDDYTQFQEPILEFTIT